MNALAPCTRCATPISPQAPACPRCGQPTPTLAAASAANTRQIVSALTLVAIGLGLWALWSYESKSWNDASRKVDAEFCSKNLDYYQRFCVDHPDHCKEGARKLARCE